MTFKHITFDQSPIMRAFADAVYKNWAVKDKKSGLTIFNSPDKSKVERRLETLNKMHKGSHLYELVEDHHVLKSREPDEVEEILARKAQVEKNKPTEDLMQNIMKLCAGLRAQGLHTSAEELEFNFFNYKKATSLYETSNEEGEDLINAAHPEGSHQMENVDSKEALFETILDNQIKMLKSVEKKPTGKLSSAKEIIGSVKKVLGEKFSNEVIKAAREILTNFNAIDSAFRQATGSYILESDNFRSKVTNSTVDNLKEAKDIFEKYKAEFLQRAAGELQTRAQTVFVTIDNELRDILIIAQSDASKGLFGDSFKLDQNQAKLSNAKAIINAVKVVLGQENDVEKQIKSLTNRILSNWEAIENMGETEGRRGLLQAIVNVHAFSGVILYNTLFKSDMADPTLDNLISGKSHYQMLKGFINFNASQDVKIKASKYFPAIEKDLASAINLRKNQLNNEPGPAQNEMSGENSEKILMPEQTITSTPSIIRLEALNNQLDAYLQVNKISTNQALVNWINGEKNRINQEINRLDKIPSSQLKAIEGDTNKIYNDFKEDIGEFFTNYIKPKA